MARSAAATGAQRSLRPLLRAAPEARRFRHGERGLLVMDWNQQPGFTAGLVGNSFRDRELPELGLRSQIHPAHDRAPALARGRCAGSSELICLLRGTK